MDTSVGDDDSSGESLGEALLGTLVDRAHTTPPSLVAPLVAREVVELGGRDVTIWLQDFDQVELRPLPGRDLLMEGPVPIDGSAPGRAFTTDEVVVEDLTSGHRVHLPMLDGSDRVGVMSVTVEELDEAALRLGRRLAGLVADLVVTKGAYTDQFFLARRSKPMTLSAQVQWHLLPPLTMITPQLAVGAVLEPAYDVGGDSFDYALNDTGEGQLLHLAVLDAMGHGMAAAVMATVAVHAYRHARRAGAGLVEQYTAMDEAVRAHYGDKGLVTAQLAELDPATGLLRWVNAGHPLPLLVREGGVARALTCPPTMPAGVGGRPPQIATVQLQPGDRVLFSTDGVVEERMEPGRPERFGQQRFLDVVEEVLTPGLSVQESVRRLSHALMAARGGRTSDDTSLVLVEWTTPDPGAPEDLLTPP